MTPGASLSGFLHTSDNRPVGEAVMMLAADWSYNEFFWTRTNAQGRYQFQDLPANGWDMSAWGAGKQGDGSYILTVEDEFCAIPEKKLQLQPGEHKRIDLQAYPETTLVRCQVVTVDENQPLAGARLGGSNAIGEIGGYTDANGIYVVRILPGETTLWFHSPPDDVYVLDGQNPEECFQRFTAKGDVMDIIIKSPPIAGYLVSITGSVHLGEDAPFALGTVHATASQRFDTATTGENYIRSTKWDSQGLFTIKGVPAGLELYILAETKDRSFAGTGIFEIPHDPHASPVVVNLQLEPTTSTVVTMLDKQGDPVPNTRFEVFPLIKGQWFTRAEQIRRSNARGQLAVEGVIPGLTYRIRDARFDGSRRFSAEERESWVNTDMVLLPTDPPLGL